MGTTAEKLAYLKETKNQIKQALETPSNVMKDYANWIKKYVDNQPTSKVSDGVCKNALDVPLVSMGVDGQSYQGENPSPDNPQDIEVIKGFEEGNQYGLPHGCIGLKQSGKNLFNYTKIIGATIKGITCTLEKPNKLVFNGIATGDVYFGLYPNLEGQRLILPSGIYFFKETFENMPSGVECVPRIRGTQNANIYNNSSFAFNDGDYIFCFLYIPNGTVCNDMKLQIQINQGNKELPYEPYHSPKLYPINLNGNSLAKVEDIKDLLKIYRNGDVEIGKNIGKVVLDGSEDIKDEWQQLEHVDYIQFYLSDSIFNGNFKDSKGKCNIFNTVFDTVWVREKECMAINSSTQYTLQFKFLRSRFANLDQFKQYLSDRYNAGIPVEVYYELAEPETIKLPSIEPIELWEGTNKFELITNLDTTFEMEYVVNKDSVLNEVQTAMLEAEIEI